MNWKQLTASLAFASVALSAANGTVLTKPYIFNSGLANGGVIPDSSLSGWQNTQSISDWTGIPWFIANVQVSLKMEGGFNGDLYAYLSHDGGTIGNGFSVLLNRVGRSSASEYGYGTAGFINLVLSSDSTLGATDVHFNGGAPSGTWQPDGRVLGPLSNAADFDTAPRPALLSSFDNLNPNGTWTLFIADASPGGVSAITEWGLEITAVPEPRVGLVISLIGFGAGLAKLVIRRRKATQPAGPVA
jgi:subtilisin-like proprotein convertase family protein